MRMDTPLSRVLYIICRHRTCRRGIPTGKVMTVTSYIRISRNDNRCIILHTTTRVTCAGDDTTIRIPRQCIALTCVLIFYYA